MNTILFYQSLIEVPIQKQFLLKIDDLFNVYNIIDVINSSLAYCMHIKNRLSFLPLNDVCSYKFAYTYEKFCLETENHLGNYTFFH